MEYKSVTHPDWLWEYLKSLPKCDECGTDMGFHRALCPRAFPTAAPAQMTQGSDAAPQAGDTGQRLPPAS